MKELIVRDRVINDDPLKILDDIRSHCRTGKLEYFRQSGSGIAVKCPHHSEGKESHPSCYLNTKDDSIDYLFCHCFTCGYTASFPKFVGECFNRDEEWGENWLLANYASDYVSQKIELNKIVLNNVQQEEYLDESVLDTFESYHPYMKKRKLSDEVISKFDIKYDSESKCIVFPVRDSNGRLVALTRRSIESKRFDIPKGFNKKNIYLLDACKNEKEVVVCESQINALTCWGWGYPAIGMFGAGTTKEQIDELNKTGIRHFILAYDPDSAGKKGASRFKNYINKRCFVDELDLPLGKDINDLTKEEFDNIVSLQTRQSII